MVQCLARLLRKKYFDPATVAESPLARCLNVFDLILFGISPTIGSGIYIVIGQIAKYEAGSAVVISLVIAGIAALLSATSYAELGAKIPRAGSAYVYTYTTVGEFWAFVIGWNIILEYIIGAATIAQAFSSALDALTGYKLSSSFQSAMPIDVPGFAPYPEWVAFIIIIIFTGVLMIGAKETSRVNAVCTCVNLVILLYAIICGLFRVDRGNWDLSPNNIPSDSTGESKFGVGGFSPYGANGILTGAATSFFLMIGFDYLSTASEETDSPPDTIPLSMLLALLINLVLYIVFAVILTLIVPYFQLPDNNALALVFDNVGWHVAKYIILVGVLFSLAAGLIINLFAAPRIIYSMASDGLLFRALSHVNGRFQVPVFAILVSSSLSAFLALLFDLHELVNMMSIGSLLAYAFASVSVILLRYDYDQDVVVDVRYDSMCNYFRRNPFILLLWPFEDRPSSTSAVIVKCMVFLHVVVSVALSALLTYSDVFLTSWWSLLLIVVFILCIIGILAALCRQPQSPSQHAFKVPFPLVPVIPMLGIFVNIYLMFHLSPLTWLRFAGWMLLGFVIYFLYGMWFSLEEDRLKKKFESAQDHLQFEPLPIEPLGLTRRLSGTSSEFSLGDDKGRSTLVLTHRQLATEKTKLVIGQ